MKKFNLAFEQNGVCHVMHEPLTLDHYLITGLGNPIFFYGGEFYCAIRNYNIKPPFIELENYLDDSVIIDINKSSIKKKFLTEMPDKEKHKDLIAFEHEYYDNTNGKAIHCFELDYRDWNDFSESKQCMGQDLILKHIKSRRLCYEKEV